MPVPEPRRSAGWSVCWA